MSDRAGFKRYILIFEKISRGQYPSLENLENYLQEQGLKTSIRTIERDLAAIRDEFGIHIRYDRKRRGYFIDRENEPSTNSFMRFLEITAVAYDLTESIKKTKEALSCIQFDSSTSFKGIELLTPLIKATIEKRKVNFTHESYETGKKNTFTLGPYLLKQYQNRWYVIGSIEGREGFLTFGIDRIENLLILEDKFSPDSKVNPSTLFAHTIGLTYSTHQPVEIELRFTSKQGKYIKTLPLHPSQVILEDDEHFLIIKLFVVPNFELKQKLLMLGDSVKVAKPEWLADEIAEDLQNALKNYQ